MSKYNKVIALLISLFLLSSCNYSGEQILQVDISSSVNEDINEISTVNESITTIISNSEIQIKVSDIDSLGERKRSNVPILIAEDSPLLNKLIVDSLKAAGYNNLIHTENGQKAYDIICQCKQDGSLNDHVRCIITDIEMPMMDGHRLTKLVKSDDATAHIPIVIFSSLVNDEMKRKGEALGADAQLSKPEIGNLVKIIDELVASKHLDE